MLNVWTDDEPKNASPQIPSTSKSPSPGKQCVFFEFSSDYTKDQFMELLKTRDENPETNVYRRYFRRIVEGAMIFSNSGIAKDFLIPGISFPATLMRYGRFDYTILLPDPWFDGEAE